MCRRSAPTESSADGPLTHMRTRRSRSAHKERSGETSVSRSMIRIKTFLLCIFLSVCYSFSHTHARILKTIYRHFALRLGILLNIYPGMHQYEKFWSVANLACFVTAELSFCCQFCLDRVLLVSLSSTLHMDQQTFYIRVEFFTMF